MAAFVSSGTHGTSVTVRTRHSEAGTVAEVCTTAMLDLLQWALIALRISSLFVII